MFAYSHFVFFSSSSFVVFLRDSNSVEEQYECRILSSKLMCKVVRVDSSTKCEFTQSFC